jgi:hypothetical protein
MKSHPYKGVYVINCPNRCEEKLVDRLIEKNTKEGNLPRLKFSGVGISCRVLPWSPRLGRYPKRTSGDYAFVPTNFCPACGARLEDRNADNSGD